MKTDEKVIRIHFEIGDYDKNRTSKMWLIAICARTTLVLDKPKETCDVPFECRGDEHDDGWICLWFCETT